ncbi:serine O-acetyltransferase EpsC [Sphingomonas sp. CARO-RG-8B-R24-01]|uniref:serine O-acetyltransferase EpsC n=1 Tax=Sphingomonas sp. CARO-RG-8B-R24-01 TaxID=2914831 RepID=UPI001F5727CD|nr:serine O-acetyltransferase EpsC [Sphingomonas sp. CARO-RG-8B-R24-01]
MINRTHISAQPRAVPTAPPSIDDAVADLRTARAGWRARQEEARDVASFPSRTGLEQVVALLSSALYPRRLGHFRGSAVEEDAFVAGKLRAALTALEREIAAEIGYWQHEAGPFEPDQAATIARLFAATLGDIRRRVDSDVEAAFLGDPAARSVDEILVCYPGAIASLYHRIAHELHNLGAPIVARVLSEMANERTGIDIHPGATIGESFFIDHGTGVVIGETAIVGARVRLYQHVTLGARSPAGLTRDDVRERHARHPILGDDVVVYAGTTILGRVTIGARSTIGGNVWLLSDVPEDSVLVQPEAVQLPPAAGRDLRDVLQRAAAH